MDPTLKTELLKVAAKSPCEKRKVGAIIVSANGNIISVGYNHVPYESVFHQNCEDEQGNTLPTVVHAEDMAIQGLKKMVYVKPLTMYVTHQPCENCQALILKSDVDNVEVINEFMKFDTGKTRYDLLPPLWIEGDAIVLTKGAAKYQPWNWEKVKPEDILRYYAAAMRHMQDWLKYMQNHPEGALFDNGEMGIGTHHLMNARTNLGFLLTLTETEDKANAIRDKLKR